MAETTAAAPKKMTQYIIPTTSSYLLLGDEICAIMTKLDNPSIQNIVNLLTQMESKLSDSHSSQMIATLFIECRDKLASNMVISKDCSEIMFATGWNGIRNLISSGIKIDWNADVVAETTSAVSELVINKLINSGFLKKTKATDRAYNRLAELRVAQISSLLEADMSECGRDKLKYVSRVVALIGALGGNKRRHVKKAKKDPESADKDDDKKEDDKKDADEADDS